MTEPNGYSIKFNLPQMPDMDPVLETIRRNHQTDKGYASILYERLMAQIADFEKGLNNDEEIGAYLASFGKDVLVRIKDIGYHNPYFVVFYGTLENGDGSVQLVQHVSQINVLLVSLKIKTHDQKARRIGFINSNQGSS